MDERGLKYFETVVRSGSIRGASELLHIAPSAISRQIRELERVLSIRLLDRMGQRGVRPTDAGSLLLRHIKDLRLREDNFRADLSDLNRLRTGTLRIASGGGFARDLITNVLQIFARQYPGICFVLSVCSGDEVIRQVRDDRADVGLLISFPGAQPTAGMSTIKTLLSDDFQPLSLIVNSSSSDAKRQSISFPDLQGLKLAMLNEFFIVTHLLKSFEAQHRIRLAPVFVCDSFDAITSFLVANIGASVLPAYCVAGELVKGSLTSIPITDVLDNRLSIDLVVNSERAEGNCVSAFCECVSANMLAFNTPSVS